MIKSCKYCANRITDNSGVSYCKMQKSTRTYNGLKLVKANSMACVMYKRKDMTKEETMEEPKELIIGFIKDDNGDWVLNTHKDYEIKEIEGKYKVIKKKPQYPKNYIECCKILNYNLNNDIVAGYKYSLLENIQKLLICRDTYYKIAGEQMGLDKSWEPDFTNTDDCYFAIKTCKGKISLISTLYIEDCILAFPTEEMRDVFYENFKELINECKELL